MFKLKPEEKETAMTTVILGKFKWLFIYIKKMLMCMNDSI